MTTKTDTRKSALKYAEFFWHIFPIVPGTKKPLTKNGYKDATTDPITIGAWWDKYSDANIGLACGMSGIVALDGDPHHYDDSSREFINNLIEEHPTAMQVTPTGGQHFIYMIPPGVTLSNSPGDLPPGIDVRVNGYIALSPSTVTYRGDDAVDKGVEDGFTGRYRWNPSPKEMPPSPLPEHVLALLKPKQERQSGNGYHLSANTNGYHASNGQDTRYAASALEKELDALARTPEGGRNEQLNRSAFSLGQLVGGGVLDEGEVINKLETVGLGIGLDEREVKRTIQSGLTKGKTHPRGVPEPPRLRWRKSENADTPEEQEFDIPTPKVFDYHPEDGGILDAWIDTFSNDWVYITGYEAWYGWAGTHWQLDDMLSVEYQLEEMIRAMNEQAREAAAEAKKHGDEDKEKAFRAYVSATKRSKSRVSSVEGMARSQRTRSASMLDRGNALNLLNGTLDLDTLILHDHNRADMLTYCLPYEYDYYATCPRFKQFISEVLVKEDGKTADPDLALLCQELVGYSLTRDTNQETMVWLSGEGGNGKTVMITVLSKLLGPLAVGMNFQTIGMAGNYDLADLPGKRIVFSTESERGGNMAEGYIKRIVSGETISARPIYGKPFNFQSTAKIWWAMNDKPAVKDTSNALHRRLKLIPFYRVFKDSEKDIHLIDKLSEELPGILNWALGGLLRLREQGQFTAAAAVDAAKDEFRYESNPVAQWLRECTESGGETLATSAFQNYALWCTRSNNKELNSTNFGRELARLNIKKDRKRSGQFYGFSLLESV